MRAVITRSHLSWLSTILYQLSSSTIHSILCVQFACLTVFLHNLSPLSRCSLPPLHTSYTWYPIISGEWNRRNIFKTDIKYQPASDQQQPLPTSAVADAHTVRVISGICHFVCVQVCALTEKQLDVSTPNIWQKIECMAVTQYALSQRSNSQKSMSHGYYPVRCQRGYADQYDCVCLLLLTSLTTVQEIDSQLHHLVKEK